MSIEKRTLANGKVRYDVVVYQESRDARGRRRKYQKTARTLGEARALEATLKVEAMAGGVRDSRRTVADLMGEWLKQKAIEGRSPTTLANYATLARRDIVAALGAIKLGPRHLESRPHFPLAQRSSKALRTASSMRTSFVRMPSSVTREFRHACRRSPTTSGGPTRASLSTSSSGIAFPASSLLPDR